MLDKSSIEKPSDTNKCRLVMTLLVRDEADIIRQNIDFHLARGVDFIIATDNASVDGTQEILREYEERGVLRLLIEEKHNFSQADWVNRMGRLAYEEHGADVIINGDSDEFWYPRSGNLKNEILMRGVDALYVNVCNVLIKTRGGAESFPEDVRYAAVNPFASTNVRSDWRKVNLYLIKCLEKVFFNASKGFIEVTNGNHNVVRGDRPIETGISLDILIYHYPLRGKAQFYRKVINGGSALAANKKYSQSTGLHWRRWYESYQNGRLDEEYDRLTLKEDEAERLLAEGIIAEHDFGELMSRRVPEEPLRGYDRFYSIAAKRRETEEKLQSGKLNRLKNLTRIFKFQNVVKSVNYIAEFGFADFLRRTKEALRQHQR